MIQLYCNMYSLFCIAEKIRTIYHSPKKENNESIKLKEHNQHSSAIDIRRSISIKELHPK